MNRFSNVSNGQIGGCNNQNHLFWREDVSYIRCCKKVPPFDKTKEQNDKMARLSEYKATVVYVKLECIYLAF